MSENSTQREGQMAALAVAQQITETTSVTLSDMLVGCNSLDIMVLRQPEDVVVLAAEFRFGVALREQLAGNGRPLMEARGEMSGVLVRFWALGVTEDWDRYREVLAGSLVGLPSEWVAGVPA